MENVYSLINISFDKIKIYLKKSSRRLLFTELEF